MTDTNELDQKLQEILDLIEINPRSALELAMTMIVQTAKGEQRSAVIQQMLAPRGIMDRFFEENAYEDRKLAMTMILYGTDADLAINIKKLATISSEEVKNINLLAIKAFNTAATWYQDETLKTKHGVKEVWDGDKLVGYTTKHFNVSVQSAVLKRSTLIIPNMHFGKSMIYTGGFAGNLEEFQKEIEGNPNLESPSRSHYDNVSRLLCG
jgi:hypothetical protein